MSKIKQLLMSGMVIFCFILSAFSLCLAADKTITLWSHWADHETKPAFVEGAAKTFETKHLGVKVSITWYDHKD